MSVKHIIDGSSIVVQATAQVASDLGDESVILNLETNSYFSLDAVGARVWNLIREPRRVSAIRDAIVKEYAVEPGRCERDLLELLHELLNENLVEIKDDTTA